MSKTNIITKINVRIIAFKIKFPKKYNDQLVKLDLIRGGKKENSYSSAPYAIVNNAFEIFPNKKIKASMFRLKSDPEKYKSKILKIKIYKYEKKFDCFAHGELDFATVLRLQQSDMSQDYQIVRVPFSVKKPEEHGSSTDFMATIVLSLSISKKQSQIHTTPQICKTICEIKTIEHEIAQQSSANSSNTDHTERIVHTASTFTSKSVENKEMFDKNIDRDFDQNVSKDITEALGSLNFIEVADIALEEECPSVCDNEELNITDRTDI